MDQSKEPHRLSLVEWLSTNRKGIFNNACRLFMCGTVCTIFGSPSLNVWEILSLEIIFLTAAPFVGIIAFIVEQYLYRNFISASLEHTSKSTLYL